MPNFSIPLLVPRGAVRFRNQQAFAAPQGTTLPYQKPDFGVGLHNTSFLSARYLLFRGQFGQQRIALNGVHESILTLARKFVITARRAILAQSDLAVFPVTAHQ